MKILKILALILAFFLLFFHNEVNAQQNSKDYITSLEGRSKLNTHQSNNELNSFYEAFKGFFIPPNSENPHDAINFAFFQIAFGIKNAFLLIAVVFLIIGVIKLFISDSSDEDVSKWKRNIAWTTAGIILMQITFNIWQTAIMFSAESGDSVKNPLSAEMAWKLWGNIFEPLVMLFQFFASFAFLAMMIYAFYIIVTGSGEEEKLTKGKNTLIFAIIGFILIQAPHKIVGAMYGGLPQCHGGSNLWSLADPCSKTGNDAQFSDAINIIATIIKFFNGFLTVFCVIMAIYAGWLVFISRGEEEKITKAKRIIIYIIIGLTLLIASHAIFRFFIMKP